jgi:hypothetical protein
MQTGLSAVSTAELLPLVPFDALGGGVGGSIREAFHSYSQFSPLSSLLD